MPVFEVAPAGALPFCLCGKPLVQPGAVGEGVRPGHVTNWVIQPTQEQGIYKKYKFISTEYPTGIEKRYISIKRLLLSLNHKCYLAVYHIITWEM